MERIDSISEPAKVSASSNRESDTTAVEYQKTTDKSDLQVAVPIAWERALEETPETYTSRELKKTNPQDLDISNLVISTSGEFYHDWHTVINVPSQIVEISDTEVVLECFDLDTKEIQTRLFERHNFPRKITIGENFLVIISSGLSKISIEIERDNDQRFSSATANIIEQAKQVNWGKQKL